MQWRRNSEPVANDTNELPVDLVARASGFYCCQVRNDADGTPISDVCVSVVILGKYYTMTMSTLPNLCMVYGDKTNSYFIARVYTVHGH